MKPNARRRWSRAHTERRSSRRSFRRAVTTPCLIWRPHLPRPSAPVSRRFQAPGRSGGVDCYASVAACRSAHKHSRKNGTKGTTDTSFVRVLPLAIYKKMWPLCQNTNGSSKFPCSDGGATDTATLWKAFYLTFRRTPSPRFVHTARRHWGCAAKQQQAHGMKLDGA